MKLINSLNTRPIETMQSISDIYQMLFELALLEPDNQCDTFQGTRLI